MKVLFYLSPAKGHVYPATPIMAALRERGHRVVARVAAGEIADLRSLGVEAKPLPREVVESELADAQVISAPKAIVAVMGTFVERASHEAPDLARALDEEGPDVVVVDINCWGAAAVAEASGRPWAILAPYLLPLPSRDAPPFGLGLAPRAGPLGRARDALVGAAVAAIGRRYGTRAINPLRAAWGARPLDSLEDYFRRAPLVLSLTAEPFEYPRRDWPENVRLVGPMNWAPPAPPPSWLEEMPDPLVLVTCSTERQQDAVLLDCALAGLPGRGMTVLGTAGAHDPGRFAVEPPSRVLGFLAHEPALERAVCVVCHGGMGIAQKALAAGVPLVVVPFGRDQLETARRVEVCGAGVRLPARRLSPDRLADAVERGIACRAGARRVGEAFAAAGGAGAAAEAVEGLVGAD